MPLILTAGPTAEPVTVAEAKAHLRVDGADDDALIASLIVTARLHVEAIAGLALLTQSWSWLLDRWPRGPVLKLPVHPVQSVAAVRVYDAAGAAAVLDPAGYLLDGAGLPPRLVRQGALPWPMPGRIAGGIDIAFTAGYGAAADVPAPIRQGILLLVAHWYEHRSLVEAGSRTEPWPDMVSELLAPYRAMRL